MRSCGALRSFEADGVSRARAGIGGRDGRGPEGPSGLVGDTKKRNTCKVNATRTAIPIYL